MKKLDEPKIVVVTPIFNGIAHTLAYLESLSKMDYKNYEVIIVDDGSTDGSAEKIKKNYPDTIILKGDGNLWWSGATNQGVKKAIGLGADFVFTINNDVELDTSIFKALISCYKDQKKPCLVGCKIYYLTDHNKVWYFGGELDTKIADVKMNNGVDSDFMTAQEVGVLTGMGVLVPVAAYKAIGLYDEKNFPQYLADSDFSLRAKNAGYSLFVTPDAKVYSDVASSWLRKALAKPSPRAVWELFFHIRSPHALKIRYRFYKKYWPKQRYRTMARFYKLLFLKLTSRKDSTQP